MGEMTNEGSNLGAGIDLSQFYQVFFEEAGENLDNMEQLLLNVNVDAADDEELNAIFRCAHSIKGGAATFGFNDVAELTHIMETLLDKLRRHELAVTTTMIDTLLHSGDVLRQLLALRQSGGGDSLDCSELVARIRALAQGDSAGAPVAAAVQPAPVIEVSATVTPATVTPATALVVAAPATASIAAVATVPGAMILIPRRKAARRCAASVGCAPKTALRIMRPVPAGAAASAATAPPRPPAPPPARQTGSGRASRRWRPARRRRPTR